MLGFVFKSGISDCILDELDSNLDNNVNKTDRQNYDGESTMLGKKKSRRTD